MWSQTLPWIFLFILETKTQQQKWLHMDISLHTDTQHRAVLLSSLYENLSTPQNLPYLKQSSVKCLEKIVDCYPMQMMEWSNRLHHSWFCIRSSAHNCSW